MGPGRTVSVPLTEPIPPPPPPIPPPAVPSDTEASEAVARRRRQRQRGVGIRDTILTPRTISGPLGSTGNLEASRETGRVGS